MSTYAIGDVQGCYDELQALLEKIHFDSTKDHLWFVGDLVNRGSKSLEVLRFVKNLKSAKTVLGNHDLHLLALAYGDPYPHHTLDAVLAAPDLNEIVQWLRSLPLLHHDAKLNYVMVHAGICPSWTLAQAKSYAQEFQAALQSDQLPELLKNLYGDQPEQWNENLSGWERLRFICNAFTRMRFCDSNGKLELQCQGAPGSQPSGYMPWFEVPHRHNQDLNIVFGHWAALNGETHQAHVFALDTGCAWGRCLTAMRLEDRQRFNVPCLRSNLTKL